MSHQEHGMTLLELVIVVAVVGILASIAVPTYRSHVLRANRVEGRSILLALAAAQEKFYLQCNTYAATLDPSATTDCATGLLRFPADSERGFYHVTITSADTSGWTAEAAPVVDSPQLDDVRCQKYGLTSTGARSARTSADIPNDVECWSR
jgi:type IV pilus assembly protein PilE